MCRADETIRMRSAARRIAWFKACAALGLALCALPAASQGVYPDKPVRIIVPIAAGGATDVLARLVGERLQTALGQSVVVENRPGAGGNIGATAVAKAAPDGYTLLMGTIGTNASNAALYRNMRYDTARDFAPITLVAQLPILVAVHPGVAARNLGELIALAKARPGGLSTGSSGVGASQSLATALFEAAAGIKLLYITYSGSAAMMPDLLSGRLDMAFDAMVSIAPHVKTGALRPIGITSERRSPALPDVPTLAEAGLAGFNASAWYGLFAPAGTPAPIVNRLHAEVAVLLKTPALVRRFDDLGAEPGGTDPATFGAFVQAEIVRWKKVAGDAGLRAE